MQCGEKICSKSRQVLRRFCGIARHFLLTCKARNREVDLSTFKIVDVGKYEKLARTLQLTELEGESLRRFARPAESRFVSLRSSA